MDKVLQDRTASELAEQPLERRRAMLRVALRDDFHSFVRKVFATVSPGERFSDAWYIRAIAHTLDKVAKGTSRRVIINVPPRSLKSICASVALPAFVLGHNPKRRIICVSYSEDLAKKFANDFRAVLRSSWYQTLFPETRIDRSKDTESEVRTTQRGSRLATSIGGTLTGRGGDLVIIDDPIKPTEADSASARERVNSWYRNTLLSRFDDPTRGALVLVMQRVHLDDLTGVLLEQEGFEHLCLPAIADRQMRIDIGDGDRHFRREGDLLDPVRMPQDYLDRMKAAMGSMHYSAQYQQAPAPIEGNLIRKEWFRFGLQKPRDNEHTKVVLSWDTAMKAGELNDYSVCTVWHEYDNCYYLLDVFRDRLDYPDLKRKAVELHKRWSPCTVLVEDHGSGTSLIQDLKREKKIRAIGRKAEGDKIMRMSTQSPLFEAGQVIFLRDQPWFEDLAAELLAFPNGRHDDQVDSISQALAWFTRVKRLSRSGRTVGDW